MTWPSVREDEEFVVVVMSLKGWLLDIALYANTDLDVGKDSYPPTLSP